LGGLGAPLTEIIDGVVVVEKRKELKDSLVTAINAGEKKSEMDVE
jgi:hypothetical protein